MAFPVLVPADATPTVAGARDLFLHRGAHSVRVPRDGVTVLGRLPESPLPLEEPEISYRHAELRLLGGSWQVRDAGSTNGTSVDGERIVAAVHGGFLSVTATTVTILAESADMAQDIDVEAAKAVLAENSGDLEAIAVAKGQLRAVERA